MVQYEIIKRSKKKFEGVDMGGEHGKVKFAGSGITARISDPALARDIRQSVGQDGERGRTGDILVAEVPDMGRKITSTGFGPGKWDEIRKEQNK